MQNPFTAHQNYESKPKRNAFDNSHRCYMTGKLGCIYPVLTLEVNAGDSVQIDSEFLFNFFPFVFPVQTPLKASIYFFYGRNRIFWKNWMDFAYNNKQPSHPFILQPQGKFWETGELADFLGVPTTYASLGVSQDYRVLSVPGTLVDGQYFPFNSPHFFGKRLKYTMSWSTFFNVYDDFSDAYNEIPDPEEDFLWCLRWDNWFTYDEIGSSFTLKNLPDNWDTVLGDTYDTGRSLVGVLVDGLPSGRTLLAVVSSATFTSFTRPDFDTNHWVNANGSFVNCKETLKGFADTYPGCRFSLVYFFPKEVVDALYHSSYVAPLTRLTDSDYAYNLEIVTGAAATTDLSDLVSNPFAGTSDSLPRVPLNAIPFRFYEALYNAYFRNERNDPFIVNGEIEYNKWNTTLEDGADSTPYKLYYRNWEADFLTTATQTPQQGLAPLVGINVRGDMEFLNEDGTISRIRPTIDDDGHTITGIAGVVENGTKEALRSAMELITSGISINDFRQVSSLQSWLENNLRKGLKYKDQVAANTGVKIRFDELDMPEFIGGFSRPVTMTSITQATPSTASDNALGDRAGQASVYGGSKHKISHYCDEAGYIMAVMCVYPTPVYTQLLPKYFLKSDALSYYHPQFGSIGLQPISYREVCPIQVFQESGDLDATFGYQRPWYDLIANVDQAHGNMRTNMKQYLMHRTFAGIPQLGRDFLKIDPKQLNDVFTITDDTEDVFQGQISFNIFTKRAIPRFGIPRQI